MSLYYAEPEGGRSTSCIYLCICVGGGNTLGLSVYRKKRLNFKCFQISRPYFIGRGQLGFCYAYNYAVHAVYLKDIFAVYLENVYAVHLEDEFAARHPFD